MKYQYEEIINKLALTFNGLEHLEETELADKVKEIINELKDKISDMCVCGCPTHPDYENYCSECG